MKSTILFFATAILLAYGPKSFNNLRPDSAFVNQLSSLDLRISGVPRIGTYIEINPCQVEDSRFQESGTLDPRLIGNWTQSQRYNSGDYSHVTSGTIGFSKEGKLYVYEISSRASIPGFYISEDSDPKVIAMVEMFTKDNEIYVIHPETGKSMFFVKYQINGSYLHTVTEDGAKEMWVRL